MLFPVFQEPRVHRKELSYAALHKTVEASSDLHLWMPFGRRVYLWFGVDGESGEDGLRMISFGRDRRPVENKALPIPFGLPLHLFFGTVLSAVQLHDKGRERFIVSDLHWFRGIDVSCTVEQCHKWSVIVRDILPWFPGTLFLPAMSIGPGPAPAYPVHHHEVRGWTKTGPHTMYAAQTSVRPVETVVQPVSGIPTGGSVNTSVKFVPNARKPQYREETRFWIMADAAYDLYKLFARGADGSPVFVDYACVVDRATSRWLNGLFRNIVENRSLDCIEESDDEEEFQDVRENKYTDLEKRVVVSCRFQGRLKKWVPIVGSDQPHAKPNGHGRKQLEYAGRKQLECAGRKQLETISVDML